MTAKFGVAIVGLGEMGLVHLKAAIASLFSSKVIGFDPDTNRTEMVRQKFNISTAESFQDILNDPEIQLVCIASPNEFHCDQAIKSMLAGKAVVCEKPMGCSLKEASKIVHAQETTKRFAHIGFELRHSKLYTTTKQWIECGLIGTPLKCSCTYYCSEFHLKNSWRSNSNGAFLIGEKLSHYLDIPRWWFNDDVSEVYCTSAPNFINYFKHPDNHTIICKFKKGGISTLDFNMGTAATFNGDPLNDPFLLQSDDGHKLIFLIYGSRGAIETDVFNRRIRRWEFSDSPTKLISTLVAEQSFSRDEDNEWFHNVYGQNIAVAELFAKGMQPTVPVYDAYETMRVVFACEKSCLEKRLVSLQEIPR